MANFRTKTRKALKTMKRKFENLAYKLRRTFASKKYRNVLLTKRFNTLKKRHSENYPSTNNVNLPPLEFSSPEAKQKILNEMKTIANEIRRQYRILTIKKIRAKTQKEKNFIQGRKELMQNNLKQIIKAQREARKNVGYIPKSIRRKYQSR